MKVADWQKRSRFVWRQPREKGLQKGVQRSLEGMEQLRQISKSWQPVGRGTAPCMTAAKMEKILCVSFSGDIVSFSGDIQNPPGRGPVQFALGEPALAGALD